VACQLNVVVDAVRGAGCCIDVAFCQYVVEPVFQPKPKKPPPPSQPAVSWPDPPKLPDKAPSVDKDIDKGGGEHAFSVCCKTMHQVSK